MKIGILSDTHGNLPVTASVVKLFRKAGVKAVFHCGDIGSSDVLTKLTELKAPVHVVFGNVDVYSSDWKYYPTNSGVNLYGRFGEISLADKNIALLHSDDKRLFNEVVSGGKYDFVFTGHSHEVHDYREGKTRCINPGTAGRGTPNTCAVLDLKTGKLDVLEI